MTKLSRRELLKRSSLGAAALAAARFTGAGAAVATVMRAAPAAAADPFTRALPIPPVLTDADITLRAAPADVAILDGAPTRMWTFNGTFPGPTIRRPAGEATRVTVVHDLPAEADTLTIHHHGSHSASEHDGLPEREVIAPGASRTYVYEHMEAGEPERAAMQWYHDHSHGRTSFNSWMGLAGLFILDDAFEAALPLPRGAYEIPLFITDRAFTADNQLNNELFANTSPLREIAGTTYLVNGAPQPFAAVEPRPYRLRVHNGSGFRLLNLTLLAGGDAVPVTQIGTEAGLLPQSTQRTQVLLGPAERADLVVDFAAFAGQTLLLDSVARPQSTIPVEPAAVTDGLLQLRVGTVVTEPAPAPLPQQLRPLPDWAATASQVPSRVWVFGTGVDDAGQRVHTINGRPFEHDRIDAQPELGSVETWLLLNATTRSHYIHIHDVDWVVLSRNNAAPPDYEAGLKETFRLDPGEFVLVASKFTDHLGVYMIHCHMLDHEDGGMMTAFEVVAPGAGTPTTLTPAARATADTVLDVMRRNPGRPAPAPVLRSLGTPAVGTHGGSPYTCRLA